MKIRIIILIVSVAVLAVVLYFQLRGDKKNDNLAPGVHQVKAEEVIQTSNYTYVRVSEAGQDYWCAINRTEIEVGRTYFWLKGWEMNNFQSRELAREFESIFFIETLSEKPILPEGPVLSGNPMTGGSPMPGASMGGRQKVAEKQGLRVEKAEGGITIAELFGNRKSYAGKTVQIRGEVVKFSPGIMNRNWVHIQDGTKNGVDFDLVVTTQDTVAVGSIRIFEGVISLDMDFGAGYTYDVIMEKARVE